MAGLSQNPGVTGPDSCRRTGWVCLVLVLVTLALYWPVRHYDFVQYDDGEYVFDNPTVRDGLSGWGLVWSFVDAHAANWHPLTWLSHMLDCQLFGLHAGAHHLVNVLLHCANAALLFLVLRSMTGAFWRSAFVAALFAWHPLRVESVAWISERKDVLSGFFLLLTLWAYVHHSQFQISDFKFQVGAKKWYRLALLFFILALLSKPMVVTLPFVLLLLDFWPLRRFQLSTPKTQPATLAPLLLEKLPFFFLSAVFGLITFFAQKTGGALNASKSEGAVECIAHALVGYLGYLEKFFWPHDLAVLYLRPQTVPTGLAFLAALILTGVSAVVIANVRSRPYLAVGWFWFVGMLVPVIGLVQVGLQSIADRYSYLPSIGLSVMLTWGGYEWAAALFTRQKMRFLLGTTAALVLLACAAATQHQLGYWKDTETLMERALQIDPNNYIAHSNLGVYLSKHGRTEAALGHYHRARELDPATATDPHQNALPARPNDPATRLGKEPER